MQVFLSPIIPGSCECSLRVLLNKHGLDPCRNQGVAKVEKQVTEQLSKSIIGNYYPGHVLKRVPKTALGTRVRKRVLKTTIVNYARPPRGLSRSRETLHNPRQDPRSTILCF